MVSQQYEISRLLFLCLFSSNTPNYDVIMMPVKKTICSLSTATDGNFDYSFSYNQNQLLSLLERKIRLVL